MTRPILRIKCRHCETDEGDGVTDVRGWHDVHAVQTLGESQADQPTLSNVMTFSLLDWHTHEGLCRSCAKNEAEKDLELSWRQNKQGQGTP